MTMNPIPALINMDTVEGGEGHRLLSENEFHGNSRKRKIPPMPNLSSHQANFPRKRSATACQLCRTRKTKCDNRRPICSKCMELNALCLYQDQASSESPASQILDRLEYLISLVESNSPVDFTAQRSGTQYAVHAQEGDSALISATSNLAQDEYMGIPDQEYFGSSGDILGWPIFQRKYDRRRIEALIFDPTLPCNDLLELPTSPIITDHLVKDHIEDPRLNLDMGPGISEEAVPQLVEAFLLNVHVKNPIFDPEYLRKMARSVVEDGFTWKASSCLVLIVCALASISSSFTHQSICDTTRLDDHADNSMTNTPGYYTAELYYTASRKRIGLLRNTLLATECYFMAGVYEMYSLRPLQAAISFNRACVTFQTLTRMNAEYNITESQLGKARASRLYWSCLKSEHETSVEFRFPSSGLTKLNYTSHFPPPPQVTAAEQFYRMHAGAETSSNAAHSSRTQTELETGWYYYLADIAARRILQRVIKSFYESSETLWLVAPIENVLHTAEELNRQLTEWHCTLPDVISFDLEVGAEEELAHHLQARAFEIKERIYRPFLYLMIHKKSDPSERESLGPLVQLHAATCAKLIGQWNVRHRHHGTWLMVRQSFASALLLLAALKSGLLQEQYEASVQTSLSIMRFWEDEAPDLKASRLILEDIAKQLHTSKHAEHPVSH